MVKRETPEMTFLQPVPLEEHKWLQKLVGEWTFEAEVTMEPEKPAMKFSGTERVRSIGGIWYVAESEARVSGATGNIIMILGYDPQKQRYVGASIGSMMTHLWHSEGALDTARKVLKLESVGPNVAAPGTMATFEDSIEFFGNDRRVLTSRMFSDEGVWYEVRKVNYERKK